MDAHVEEKNTPGEKTHSPPRTVSFQTMSHRLPSQKSRRLGRKIGVNHAQKFSSSNKPKQNVEKINVDAISQAPSTSRTIICRNCLSHGIPAPHDHSTIKCTKKQQISCYKCGRVGYRTPSYQRTCKRLRSVKNFWTRNTIFRKSKDRQQRTRRASGLGFH